MIARAAPALVATTLSIVHASNMGMPVDSAVAMLLLACILYLLGEVGCAPIAWFLIAPVMIGYSFGPAMQVYDSFISRRRADPGRAQ